MSTTKLELQQTNARLANENHDLRTEVADLKLCAQVSHARMDEYLNIMADYRDEIAMLKQELLNVTSVASAINTVNAARPTQPQWQIERAKAMAAARDMAMQTHMVVKA